MTHPGPRPPADRKADVLAKLTAAVPDVWVATAEAPAWVADGYAKGTDWDPRQAGGTYTYLLLRPDRIQAWREENEVADRTLMRNGTWLH